ncbi:MAG: hypothetical protein JJ992_08470, partial [Planctomycetes bacterium]|nr:hypothetical protein [Planctomycetota bacterium]
PELMRLAGFALGHAAWCVSDNEALIPFVLSERAGKRSLLRVTAERLEEAVEQAAARWEANPERAERAVLAYDGYVTIDDLRTDALIVKALEYGAIESPVRVYLRYRPGQAGEDFAIYRPTLVVPTAPDLNRRQMAQHLFAGLADHEQGSAVWARCYVDPDD